MLNAIDLFAGAGGFSTGAAAVLARWDSPQWEWTKHGPTADLMADLRAALAQPAAPDAPLVAGQVIAGAVYDLMGYLTTLDKSISLGSSELATPASDALSDWAMTRGLSLDEPDIANWHTHIAAPDVQPVARVLVWKGPRHINTPPPAARTYAEFPEQSAGPHNPDAYWHNSTPLYAAAQAAQPAPSEPKVTVTTNPAGDAVAVTLTDDDHRIVRVLWERAAQPAPQPLSEAKAIALWDEYATAPHTCHPAISFVRAVLVAAGITAAPTTDTLKD